MNGYYSDYTMKVFKDFLNALTLDCVGNDPTIYWTIRDYDGTKAITCIDDKANLVKEWYVLTQANINEMVSVVKRGTVKK